ncbi:GspH/FimT family pseudopilin [Oligoflexia bacterium]|nr:GspH/FimT family pseudopilin [Oligoflexia bacterium]
MQGTHSTIHGFKVAPKAEGGFTVIELVVTLAIIVSVAAIGNFSLANIVNSRNNSRAISEFQLALNQARAQALATGTRVVLALESSGATASFGKDRLPFNDPPSADALLFKYSFPEHITLSAPLTILFNARGFLVDGDDVLVNRSVTLARSSNSFASGIVYPTGIIEWD